MGMGTDKLEHKSLVQLTEDVEALFSRTGIMRKEIEELQELVQRLRFENTKAVAVDEAPKLSGSRY